MYLVRDDDLGCLVFLNDDPRDDEFDGEVVDGVSLEDAGLENTEWPEGHSAPDYVLGVSLTDPKEFRAFKYERELADAGYRNVGEPFVCEMSWSDYLRKKLPR